MSNLALYPVERDFAKDRKPEEVEDNFRFVDDILTLTGCIPTEEQYGMCYKEGDNRVFLGMELHWVQTSAGTQFQTGMHFRDYDYPIKIRRYPALGTMATDAQPLGVVSSEHSACVQ